ncbi:hypothetical protein [Rhodococcoides fascians]|uniref:hypothetical protein n=1 Tax=Rhodococcoides fascians TaxID=1828 RepID=UPI00050C20A0|nr:hypothetical protein [Rhodococcus fascians]
MNSFFEQLGLEEWQSALLAQRLRLNKDARNGTWSLFFSDEEVDRMGIQIGTTMGLNTYSVPIRPLGKVISIERKPMQIAGWGMAQLVTIDAPRPWRGGPHDPGPSFYEWAVVPDAAPAPCSAAGRGYSADWCIVDEVVDWDRDKFHADHTHQMGSGDEGGKACVQPGCRYRVEVECLTCQHPKRDHVPDDDRSVRCWSKLIASSEVWCRCSEFVPTPSAAHPGGTP